MESSTFYSDVTSGAKSTVWLDANKAPEFPGLTQDITADVCVIGGGIAGVTTAYLLTLEGKKVALIESGKLCSGETGRTSAHLMTQWDDRYYDAKKRHGAKAAKMIAESQIKAINLVEGIAKKENIDCEFKRVDGYLFLSEEDKKANPDLLDEEFKVSKECGLDVKMVDRVPIPDYDLGQAILYANQAQFDPLKWVFGVAQAFADKGGQIYTNTHAMEVKGGKNAYVKTKSDHKINCDHIVVCTNTPMNHQFAYQMYMEPYKSYMIGAKVSKDYLPQAMFWDTLDEYHYVRLQHLNDQCSDHNILLIGGEDHRVGEQYKDQSFIDEKYENLEKWARERFPGMGEIVSKWSGQVQEPPDGLPFVGTHFSEDKNVYVITGDSGQGMTNAPAGAILIADMVMGRENQWKDLYNASRIPIRDPKELIKHQAKTFYAYKEWLTSGDVADIEDILPDKGAVVRKGLTKHACYRDPNGTLYEMSAVCPHLEGIVVWNQSEKCFDCPCHGSKFDQFGQLITGPAKSNLPPINDAAKNWQQQHKKN